MTRMSHLGRPTVRDCEASRGLRALTRLARLIGQFDDRTSPPLPGVPVSATPNGGPTCPGSQRAPDCIQRQQGRTAKRSVVPQGGPRPGCDDGRAGGSGLNRRWMVRRRARWSSARIRSRRRGRGRRGGRRDVPDGGTRRRVNPRARVIATHRPQPPLAVGAPGPGRCRSGTGTRGGGSRPSGWSSECDRVSSVPHGPGRGCARPAPACPIRRRIPASV